MNDSEQPVTKEEIQEAVEAVRKRRADERLQRISERTANDPVWRKED